MSGHIDIENVRHLLLTGLPGSGKTTVVIKVFGLLANASLPVAGFYTKELRSGRSRIGFDIYSLDNKHAPLARISSDQDYLCNSKAPRVGNYIVDLPSFESIALPALSSQSEKAIIIIDEIGKMELFSREFENKVNKLFQNKDLIILATVPSKGKHNIIESLKKLPTAALIEVDSKNRDQLPDKIATSIKKTYGKTYRNQ